MSALSIQPTYPIFTDIDGQPLENGYIFIGSANLNPQTNPINVYWDAALTIQATQPIRTLAGYPSNSGTPARLYVNSDYSIRVQNRNGSMVYSAPTATERYNDVVVSGVNAEDVIYDPPFTNAVATNVEAKLAQTVSVKDFGAVGDGVTDDTAAIQTAINYVKNAANVTTIYFPVGQYKVTSTLNATASAGIQLVGDGGPISGTVILGDTINSPVIDFVGTFGFLVQGITILLRTSPTGVLMGFDSVRNSGNFWSRFRDCCIATQTYNAAAVSANSGLGHVGIMNYGGENVCYENLRIETVLPIILTSYPNCSWIRGTTTSSFVISSAFVTMPASWTCGAQYFVGACTLQAHTWNRPAIAVNESIGINMGGTYLQSVSGNPAVDGSYKVSFQAEAVFASDLHIYNEAAEICMEINRFESCKVHIADGGVGNAVISLYNGGALEKIQGCEFNVWTTTDRYIMAEDALAPYTGLIINCNILANQEFSDKILSPYLKLITLASRWSGTNPVGKTWLFDYGAGGNVRMGDSGDLEAANLVVSPKHRSFTNTSAVPVTTTTTVYTLASAGSDVNVYFGSVSIPTGTASLASITFMVCVDGSSAILTALNIATNLTVSVSGLNIQVSQTTPNTQNCTTTLLRIQ